MERTSSQSSSRSCATTETDASIEPWSVDGVDVPDAKDLHNSVSETTQESVTADKDNRSVDDNVDDKATWVYFEGTHPKLTPDEVYNYIVSGVVDDGQGSPTTATATKCIASIRCPRRDTARTRRRPTEEAVEISYESFLRGNDFSTVRFEPFQDPSQRTTVDVLSRDGFPVDLDPESLIFLETPPPDLLASPEPGDVSDAGSLVSFDLTIDSDTNDMHRSGGCSGAASPQSSLSPRKRDYYRDVAKGIRWWGHGRTGTCLAVALAWVGSILSVLVRQSVDFVTLATPLHVSSSYLPVDRLGLIQLELCYNETATNATGCHLLVLGPTDVNDNMYEIARLFGSLSMLLGTFLTLFLSSSAFWESINLRPIGLGLLVTYFCQSFTMLFFDAQVCKENDCRVGAGSYLSIGAAICWVAACITTATMESFKLRATRERRRQARRRYRRALREARKQKALQDQKDSFETQQTSSTSSDTSHNFDDDLDDPELGSDRQHGPCEI